MRKLSIKILVVVGLIIAGLLVWWQLSGASGVQGKKEETKIAQRTSDEMKQVITSVLTRVFSRENLLVTKIDEGDQQAWNQLVTALREYVEKNYQEKLNDFTAIVKASKQVLDTQSDVFQYISKAFVSEKDKEKGLSTFDVTKITVKKLSIEEIFEKLQVLAPYQQELAQLQVSLDAQAKNIKESWTIKKEKRQVCEVLSFFAMSVEDTINKLFNDTRAILSQRLTEVGTIFVRDNPLRGGRDNLLLVNITKPEQRAWNNLMRDFRIFISSRDQKFLDDLTIIDNASLQLITTLQSLYKAMKKSFPLSTDAVPKQEELNLDKVRATDITSQLRNELKTHKDQVTKLQESLEQTVKSYTAATPKATKFAGKLMLEIATVVRDAIQKVVDDTADVFPKFAFAVRGM